MKKILPAVLISAAIVGIALLGLHTGLVGAQETKKKDKKPMVIMKTSHGEITIELWADQAPVTVDNFLKYVDDKHFDGTIFHRVIKGFMIQGGGFTPDMKQKPCRDPIVNEATKDLKNTRGTLAMARTNVVDSATAQFFVNLVDNEFLDHRDRTDRGFGYCAFGKVVDGMDVVDKIAAVATRNAGGHQNVPTTAVEILSVRRVGETPASGPAE